MPPCFFTLRIWTTAEGDSPMQWRARLQNIHSGEVTYYKDWQSLLAYIEGALKNQADGSSNLPPPGGVMSE